MHMYISFIYTYIHIYIHSYIHMHICIHPVIYTSIYLDIVTYMDMYIICLYAARRRTIHIAFIPCIDFVYQIDTYAWKYSHTHTHL